MKSKSIVALAVIVLSLAALACSAAGIAKAPEVVSTAKAVATEVKSAASSGEATATPAVGKPGSAPTAAPSSGNDNQPLTLQSRETGLDKLKSYRMTWQADWKSTDVTSTQSVTWNWTEEYSSEPEALHWTWKLDDSKSKDQAVDMEMWQLANSTYMSQKDASGKSQCFSYSSADKSNQLTKGLFSPNALGSVSNARFVGNETVNGVKARHYKYDEKGVALFGAAKVAGDIWVAIDGEFVVKETVSWSGAAGLFGSSSTSKGDGKWNWELSDVNQPVTITAPENCGGAASDLPVMKDATDTAHFGDTLTYKSPSKLADVAAFYQKEMPAAGWKLNGEPQVTDEFAQMEFTKDSQTAQVMLSVDNGTTQVLITIGK